MFTLWMQKHPSGVLSFPKVAIGGLQRLDLFDPQGVKRSTSKHNTSPECIYTRFLGCDQKEINRFNLFGSKEMMSTCSSQGQRHAQDGTQKQKKTAAAATTTTTTRRHSMTNMKDPSIWPAVNPVSFHCPDLAGQHASRQQATHQLDVAQHVSLVAFGTQQVQALQLVLVKADWIHMG